MARFAGQQYCTKGIPVKLPFGEVVFLDPGSRRRIAAPANTPAGLDGEYFSAKGWFNDPGGYKFPHWLAKDFHFCRTAGGKWIWL